MLLQWMAIFYSEVLGLEPSAIGMHLTVPEVPGPIRVRVRVGVRVRVRVGVKVRVGVRLGLFRRCQDPAHLSVFVPSLRGVPPLYACTSSPPYTCTSSPAKHFNVLYQRRRVSISMCG